MAATPYKVFTATNVAPGATINTGWNNIPQGKAYAVDASPYWYGSTNEGFDSVTQAQVTKLSRRRRVIEKSDNQFSDTEVHNDVLCSVKNVGTHVMNFDLYLIVFS